MLIQRLINFFYRHPKAKLKLYKRFGGFINYQKILLARKSMMQAAIKLAPVVSHPTGLPVYFLTGKKYLYQTLFCIQSLNKISEARFNFILVDDNSFDDSINKQIEKQLPGCAIVKREEIEKNFQKMLPEERYSNLHRKRKEYPHLKKLTDIHTLPGNNWKLVFDSDMLFWSEPKAILDWLSAPYKPLYMQDCQNSYGYSKPLMEQLTSSKIPDFVNVGVIGLNSTQINWDKLNEWVAVLEEKEGTSYYLEQALTAMLISETSCEVLPLNEYIVNPDKDIIEHHAGILHHYVDLSKENYFKKAWKAI